MTLEAWVNPTTVTAAWRDVIYKGNDNYYLEALDARRRPAAGRDRRRHYADAFGTGRAGRQHLDPSGRDLRRRDLRLYVNGALVGRRRADRHDHHVHQPAADRWRQHLRPVLQRPDRRGPRLQHRAHRGPDPDRHEHRHRRRAASTTASDGSISCGRGSARRPIIRSTRHS